MTSPDWSRPLALSSRTVWLRGARPDDVRSVVALLADDPLGSDRDGTQSDDDLQPYLQAQGDAFDHLYNTERPHQVHPGRVTPFTAWQATGKAEAPRPKPKKPF